MGSLGHHAIDSVSQQKDHSTISFRLPDAKTEIYVQTMTKGQVLVLEVSQGNTVLSRWTTTGEKTRVSPAMVNDNVAQFDSLWQFEITHAVVSAVPFGGAAEHQDLALPWASVYALWVHPQLREQDLIAVAVNSENLGQYLRCSGLGVISPFSTAGSTTTEVPQDAIFWLHREAFWQGAGAPDSQTWVRCCPEVTQFPGFGTHVDFPSQPSFTRKGNVCAVHPVRPPKPAPGTLLYSRYIVELGEQLSIYHIDTSDPVHFEHYSRWQNSDRVNVAWRERGPDEHHRKHLAAQLADPHTMSCVFAWNGQLAGYLEVGFVKEDNVTCFIGSNCNIVVGEHDQNTHFLVGEEKFRGGKRYQAANISMKHFAFLRDSRSRQIIGEPEFGKINLAIQERFIPIEKKKRFHLPHKTSMLIALSRDRFFQEGHFL
ncbi:hypothetical protein CcaCcLH18_07078 [Colletotrichum camelliae]|nr:hypothetical protein CcaCcLH18_07078 [Colletotrichum camelliae]